jgi:hypothetical protein
MAQLVDAAAGFGLNLLSHGYRRQTVDGNVDPLETKNAFPDADIVEAE